MPQIINLDAGAVEFTKDLIITAPDGQDVTGDSVLISLGTWALPGDWVTPDRLTVTGNTVNAQMLIGDQLRPASGMYWVWVKVVDNPEIVPRRATSRLCIINSGAVAGDIDGGGADAVFTGSLDGGAA